MEERPIKQNTHCYRTQIDNETNVIIERHDDMNHTSI